MFEDACDTGDFNTAQSLVHFVDVNFPSNTPITLFSSRGYNKVYKGLTPLHLAAGHGHVKIVKLLLSHGANLNIRVNGEDPYEFAINEAAEYLLGVSRFCALHILFGSDIARDMLVHQEKDG